MRDMSDHAYKDVIIRVITKSYIDVKFAVHRYHIFSLEHIRATMRSTYRAAFEVEEKE